MNGDLARRVTAEAIGTAILLAAVVGSGVMAERLAGGNFAIVLLANSIATGAALMALILTFSAISGAHFNPVVTVSEAWGRGLSWHDVPAYFVAQLIGAFAGVAVAHYMFGLPVFFASHRERSGGAQILSEFVATFGLVCVVRGVGQLRLSFANPAVTLARSASDTFAGIRMIDVPGFIAAQFLGTVAATALFLRDFIEGERDKG